MKYILIHNGQDGNKVYQFEVDNAHYMLDGFFWGGDMNYDDADVKEEFKTIYQIAEQLDLPLDMSDTSTSVEIIPFYDVPTKVNIIV
jgi:hypothetical protein